MAFDASESLEENVTQTTAWVPGDFGDIDRVAEMMMFHEAAGGQIYTGLRHDALDMLDLSNVLVEDRCILVGRTEAPMFDLQVKPEGQQETQPVRPTGNVLSMIRVVMPVRSTLISD